MDIISSVLAAIGIKVYDGDRSNAARKDEIANPERELDYVEPLDGPNNPLSMAMFRASQPANLLAAGSDQAVPQAFLSGSMLPISKRWTVPLGFGRAVGSINPVPRDNPAVDDSLPTNLPPAFNVVPLAPTLVVGKYNRQY